MSNERFIVDVWPTGKCDMECPFCYGADVPVDTIPQVDLAGQRKMIPQYAPTQEVIALTGQNELRGEMQPDQVRAVISKLKAVGVDTLNIGGGEPLMRPETPEFIQFAHEAGLEVYLSTNGTFFKKQYDRVKDNISVLGLPLDGSTPEMNVEMGRREYTHKNITDILKYFKQNPPTHRVKVGTVVSKINIADVEQIGELLFNDPELYHPDVWRIYQFEALKEGSKNKELYEIGDAEFDDATKRLMARFPQATISPRSNNEHSNAYFFVTPDGTLQIVDTKHKSIADLLTMGTEELSRLITDFKETQSRASANRKWLG